MAQFNFPSSPNNGDSFTQNGVTFQWDGEAWRRQGVAGAQGSAGAQGASGSNGAQGASGTNGAQGSAGAQGAQGVAGSAASQGAQGAAGAQGDSGSAGSAGAQGAQGHQGQAGAAASQGAQGATGATGAQGATGSTGAQGATGSTGAQGAQGHQGNTGSTGAQGDAGSRSYTVTNSGSGAYVIDGSNNPTLNLLRGFTYTFNINASGHPFYIKTSQTTGTGNQYTNGVTGNGTQSGTLTFAVPYNAPSTLYYICQYHSAMKGTISISDVGPTGAQGATGSQGATGAQGVAGSVATNYTNSLSNSVQRTIQSKLDDFVNILDFGVEEGSSKSNTVRTNNTSRFENALAHEKRIYIPAGTYEFNDEIDIANKTVTLFGDSERLSILSWETATGANGIHWSTNNAERTLTVRDLKLRTSADKSGSPIYAQDTSTSGGTINPNVVIENVVADYNGNTSRWQKGFRLEDCRNSYCNRAIFRGNPASTKQSDYGFLMDGNQIGCLDVVLSQCQVSDLRGDPGAAFLIRGTCEGIHIQSCLAINTDRGVQSDNHQTSDGTETGEPFVTVSDCHFNVHEKGIIFQRVLQSFISNNHIQACNITTIGSLVNWLGIEFASATGGAIKCQNIQIHQNLFHAGFSERNSQTDKGAYINYAENVCLDNNQFKGCDDPVIEITNTVSNSQVLNNRFDNCDTPHITNNGTNVITATPAGAQGDAGAQGATGSTGAQGHQGHQGATGSGGSTGAQGATGSGGSTGAQGASGTNGAQGAAGSAGSTGIPSGFIGLWSGAANAIPSGWYLCDGNNSTPDLRARFVVGAGDGTGDGNSNYSVGDNGGAEFVTLSVNQIPSHTHSVNLTTDNPGNHSHSYNQPSFTTYAFTGGGGSQRCQSTGSSATSAAGGHTHTVSGNTGGTGGGSGHENRPPYYALCYIMKS